MTLCRNISRRRTPYGVCLLLSLVMSLLFCSCVPQIVLNYSLKRDYEKDTVRYNHEYQRFKAWNGPWALNLRDTVMESPVHPGTTLHALYRYADKPTTKTAFILHGYGCNGTTLLGMARFYSQELGYNVFLPEFYAHGKSEGKMRQMGWLDRLDMLQWMEMANQLFRKNGEDTQMVVTGVSMGGATTMMISGDVEERGLSYVKCFVEDCGYTDVFNQFSSVAKGRFTWVLKWTSKRCKRRYGWDFKEASALKQVERCNLPMLFIHGGADTYVPTKMVHEVYEVKQGDKDLWIPNNISHAQSFDRRNREYREQVREFVSKYIQ